MAMVDVGHITAYRWTCSPSQLAWSENRQLPGADLHSSNDLCNDDSTINTVPGIIIIIISSVYLRCCRFPLSVAKGRPGCKPWKVVRSINDKEDVITSPQPLASTLRRCVVVPGNSLPTLANRNRHGTENVCGPAYNTTSSKYFIRWYSG